ncbi:hypothetical protein MMC11_000716 [Xylographa trunciseda]|nr:hypothetical protein [Xylographa trunciseda]
MSFEMVRVSEDSSGIQDVCTRAEGIVLQDHSDETYAKLLLNIDKDDVEYASAVFQWLAYSQHTISVEQLAEALLVDTTADLPYFDEARQRTPQQIIEICSGLVEIATVEQSPFYDAVNHKSQKEIFQFSHSSVKDYLLSKHIQAGPARIYSIQKEAANMLILNTCLAYILNFANPDFDLQETLKDSPLAHYAALLWVNYITPEPEPKTLLLLKKLFQDSDGTAYRNWLHLVSHHSNAYSNDSRIRTMFILNGSSNEGCPCYAPPLVWASGLGLTSMVHHLLTTDSSIDVNEPGVANVSALGIATHQQHHEIMELLLLYGGDVSNSHEEEDSRDYEIFRAPLYNAARSGHFKAIEILLRDRSRFGKPGWILEVALEGAAGSRADGADGAIDCIRQLVDAGVNVNSRSRVSGHPYGDKFSCALDAACQHGCPGIVRALLDAGADPNLHIGKYGFTLQAAAYWGGWGDRGGADIMHMLLDAGADPNARSGPYGTALIAASFRGFADSVSVLLAAGADTTIKWNLRSVLHELNVRIYEPNEDRLAPGNWHQRFQYPHDEHIERELENVILTTRARRPLDDDIFGGEWELWRRIKAHTIKLSGSMLQRSLLPLPPWAEMNRRQVLVVCCGTLMEIRVAGRRIAEKLKMAGVAIDRGERYMFNAMQAAKAGEWEKVVDVLKESGMDVPPRVENGGTEEEAQKEEVVAEAIARLLRVRSSYDYSERTRECQINSRRVSMMPMNYTVGDGM